MEHFLMKMTTKCEFFVIIGIALLCGTACGFNLESRIPVIKRGATGSYFGYAVAEHQELVEKPDKSSLVSWILVGAPLDQNLQPQTNRSGALWRCPLTTETRDCEQVVTDGRTNIDSDMLYPPNGDEVNDDQWLGVTVQSQGAGKLVLVCAHRYMRKNENAIYGQGKCYILNQDLKIIELKKPCAGKPTARGHVEFAYCQAGTSGVLATEDSQEWAFIGIPGPYIWRGTTSLFTVSVPGGDDFLKKDRTTYEPPGPESPKMQIDKYSYLGMSVTAGNFFGEGLCYAAGAPRSNGTGQVVIFTKQYYKQEMQTALYLNGYQFASSFGYQIASADVNGDEISDLIVSAPFFFNKTVGGAVYVYTKLCKNNVNDKKCKPVQLVGREESRFGFSLANLGDLNKDGYEDIAIGAPYEGKGAVYVYLGSKNGLITSPSQVIYSEETPVPLRTFGYSLSGGMDLDSNGYPDLLIGAYDDDAVVLLRARKIINITTSIRYATKNETYENKIEPIDPNKFGCPADVDSIYTCFTFEACCSTESLMKYDDMQYLSLNYTLEAETYAGLKKFSRVWFGNGDSRPHLVNRIVTLDKTKLTHCQPETIYLKENTRDIQSPIKFRLNYTLIQKQPVVPREGDPLPEIKNYPILNQQEAARVFEATFQKDCGNNDICESDLRVQAKLNLLASKIKPNFYELLLGEKEEVVVDVNAVNIGESAYEANLFITHSSSLSYIARKSSDESIICNVYNATIVTCAIGNPFKKAKSVNIQVRFDPKGLEDNESQLDFVVFANSTSKEVKEKEPLKLYATILKRAELSIKGAAKAQTSLYGGPIIGESAIKNLNEIGPRVSHIYTVFNEGPWKVNNLEVRISWPYEVANDKIHGKWLLYLEETPTVQALGDGECTLSRGHVANPLKLPGSIGFEDIDPFSSPSTPSYNNMNDTNFERSRRDTEKVVNTQIFIDEDGKKQHRVNLNCKAGTAKCFDITCVIYNLQRKQEATITVKARLWNSTLVEDYPKLNKVIIASNARIVDATVQQDTFKDDYATAETIVSPDLIQHDGETVPIWVIIVAIVAGLLLLILLTLLLWKLGFFKRRRPDPTLSGNLEKHREDNPESEALFKR